MRKEFKDITCMVVSLPERTDRYLSFVEEFRKHFINELILIQAVKYEPGHIGCNRSHKDAIKAAAASRLSDVLIFEDDFQFVSDKSFDYMTQAYNNLPNDYDLALFGYYYLPKKTKVNNYWNRVDDFCALHCYLVNERVYPHILNLRNDYHLDRLMGRNKAIDKLAINYLPTKQRNGFSDNANKDVNYDSLLEKFKLI